MPHKSIIISNAKYTEVIRTDEILFCKAAGSYSEIVLINQKKIIATKNLCWFEKKCNSDEFCRIHKSFLVNLQYVNKIFHFDNMLLLTNGIKVPISKTKKKIFWEKIHKL